MTAIRHHDGRRPRSIFITLTIAAACLSRRSNTRVQRVHLISDNNNRGNDNARHRRDVHGDFDVSRRCGHLSGRSNTHIQRIRLNSDNDDRGNNNARRRRDLHGDVDASRRCGRLSGRSNTRVQQVRLISDDDNRGKDNACHNVCGNNNAITVSNPMPQQRPQCHPKLHLTGWIWLLGVVDVVFFASSVEGINSMNSSAKLPTHKK